MNRRENRLNRLVQRLRRRERFTVVALMLAVFLMVPLGAWGTVSLTKMFNGDQITIESGDNCIIKDIGRTNERPLRRQFSCTRLTTTTTLPPTTTTTVPPTTTTTLPSTTPKPPALVPWATSARLVFEDAFDGAAVDLNKWNVFNADARWGEETYRPAQTMVNSGTLKLVGKQNGTGYDSGAVSTRNYGEGQKFAFKYGYVEARIRCPKGGTWPAFWLVGDNQAPGWPAYGEWDIMEQYGTEPGQYEATTHWANASGGTVSAHNPAVHYAAGTTAQDFHNYGLLWESGKLSYVLDGKVVATWTPPAGDAGAAATLGYGHTIILNLAMGGSTLRTWHGWDGTWPAGTLPATMEVDYVRVWQP